MKDNTWSNRKQDIPNIEGIKLECLMIDNSIKILLVEKNKNGHFINGYQDILSWRLKALK